jgi:NitT/TauT family transport system ATP-binding protein
MAPAGGGMSPVIEVVSLRKDFKGRDGAPRAVLKDLDLNVGAGEFVCILGPSGCGKSTLLNVLAGLDRVYAGQARVSGGRVGYLFQEPRLLPWLTAEGNLDFALTSCRVPASRWEELKSRYLAMTGLSEYRDYYPHQISGGMAQRLALVRALCVEPSVLLMDEPFSGLDEITARRIRSDLLAIWEETRKTVVFVTHNAYEACFLADRILVMSGGAFQQEMRVPVARPRDYEDPAIFQFSRDVIKAFGDEIGREPVPLAIPPTRPELVDGLDRHAAARMNI